MNFQLIALILATTLGFEEDGDVLRWKDNDRNTIVRRYLRSGPSGIHPSGITEDVTAFIGSGGNVDGSRSEAAPGTDTGAVAGGQTASGTDPSEPSVLWVANTVATMIAPFEPP